MPEPGCRALVNGAQWRAVRHGLFHAHGGGKIEYLRQQAQRGTPDSRAAGAQHTCALRRTLRAPAILMTLALLAGVFFLTRFFSSDDAVGEGSAVKKVVEQQKAAVPSIDHAPGPQPATVVTKAPVTAQAAATPKQPTGVEYVLKVAETARARHASWYGARDIVEFRSIGAGQVVDRFTTEQL